MGSLLVRFLEQNNGILCKRAKAKEFSLQNEIEVKVIEKAFQTIFEI